MNKAAIRRDLQYRADEQLVRNLLKLLRRERMESIVLKYINGMREIVGAQPVGSIWAACAFFRDHELDSVGNLLTFARNRWACGLRGKFAQ